MPPDDLPTLDGDPYDDVPVEQQLDLDDGDPDGVALEGGADDDLDDVYADPEGHL